MALIQRWKNLLSGMKKSPNSVTNQRQIIENYLKENIEYVLVDYYGDDYLIAKLFGVGRSTITEHINNILSSGELDENNTVGKNDVDNFLN